MSWPADNSAEAAASGSPASLAEQDKLLVFGYECKIFRDDEKAEWIDKEKHLIPWMGDPSVLIDRYDGRGALMDLRGVDAQAAGVAVENLEEEDDSIEALCEEERYRELHEDEEYDESAYQEEEFKRLQLAVSGMGMVGSGHTGKSDGHYSAIGYSYDANNGLSMGPEPKRFNEDLPYVQPSGLYVPPDILLPTTMKSHAVIEKTAKFIAEQGNQMEIILKTKQSTNPQFDFLGYNDVLNPYYKYLVLVIKTGEYKPAEVATEDQYDSTGENDFSGSEEDCDTSYLHPSLVKKNAGATNIPKIVYKPTTTNSTYSILVSKIQGAAPQEPQKSQTSTESVQVQKEETNSVISHSKSTITGVPVRQPHEMPTTQDQLIIEKMANYVVKNGSAFEGLAKTKGDPRFTFLDSKHTFHWYYLNCKERFKAEHTAVVATGTFVSYNKGETKRKLTETTSSANNAPGPGHTSSLPLSAAGIPIANHASIQSRPTTMSAELVSRIEEIRKKNALFSKSKDKATDGSTASLPCDNSNSISTSISNAFSLASATAQRILAKEKPVIKFSSTLGNQSSLTNDPQEKEDVSISNHSSKSSRSHGSITSFGSENTGDHNHKLKASDENRTEDVIIDNDEADRKRKEERRKKAALFLEKIKNTTLSALSTDSQITNKEDTTEVHSDVESLPSPSRSPPDVEETFKENEPGISAENEVLERLKFSPDSDLRNGSRNSSTDKKHRNKRSLSSSSIESSYSDIHPASSSSSSSKKKRSKRKHSKKRKKKHEKSKGKEKSRSHSKKSKRHKR